MTDLYLRLLKAGRSAEAHFFAYGEHGTGFALGDPLLGSWPDQLRSWMRTNGFLTGGARVAVRGRIKVDGEPLPGKLVGQGSSDETGRRLTIGLEVRR